MNKWHIDTPALLVDLPTMERNIAVMADFARRHKVNLRPHVKTHKSTILAKKQLEAGASGISCAKLGEAEVMAGAGINDILITNLLIGSTKIARLLALAQEADLIVTVDDYQNATELSAAFQAAGAKLNTIVEIDLGMCRCGVEPGQAALSLAKHVDASPGLRFCGFTGYEGHIQLTVVPKDLPASVREEVAPLIETADMARAAGLRVDIVSAGGSISYRETGKLPGITEIQPGAYIFMDSTYYPRQTELERALTVLTTVISRPKDNYIMVDAGSKSLSQDWGIPEVKDIPGAKIVLLSEEQMKIEFTGSLPKLSAGDKIEIFPSHVCTTVNLHDRYRAIRNDCVEAVWDVEARGKIT
ncbi:DSD1 family PLP-dependent enzyme [Chloroflexota bacterium]